MAKQKYDYDLIVIGSGAGGSIAAHSGAALGKKVAVVEAGDMGGECPNWECVPSKSLLHVANIYDAAQNAKKFGIRSSTLTFNYPSIKAWRDKAVHRTGMSQSKKMLESEGITVFRGKAEFVSPHKITINRQKISSDKFLVATGSTVDTPPVEGIDDVKCLTYREAGTLTRPPKSIFVIGAGATGCEYATLFSVFGSKVYIADVAKRPLPTLDSEVGDLLQYSFQEDRRIVSLMNTKVLRVTKEGISKRVYFQQGHELKSVKVDEIMIATGKRPRVNLKLENAGVEYSRGGIIVNSQMQTSAKNIYAAGDVTGLHMLTHVAIHQSRVAGNNMWRKQKINVDYSAIPRCVYTLPEVATVGSSENECVKRDIKIKKAITPLSIISRASIADESTGFVKVITKTDGTLIGATIVGPDANEIIHELTLAIQYGLTAQEVAHTLHAFSTWSEAIRVACTKIR